MAFVKFATDTRRLADQARYISYGPARQSSLAMLNEDIKSYLPTASENAGNAIRIDAQWWAEHQDALERRFEHWRGTPTFYGLVQSLNAVNSLMLSDSPPGVIPA